MQPVFGAIRRCAETDSTVLITGKTGTGKELVARAIHFNSSRKHRPFITINCGAIVETLLESELFGHKRGAFTGAVRDKKGLIAAADRGTLFLDEVAEISTRLQVKLLRVLDTKEVTPVGATAAEKMDVRILAATNRDLQAEVDSGRFREDLFYRLNVLEIELPGLKERQEDIPYLVEHFIGQYSREMNKSVKGVTPAVLKVLSHHEWRGEVRELENIIERAMIFCDSEMIDVKDLPISLKEGDGGGEPGPSTLHEAVAAFEKRHIEAELRRADFDKKAAAEALGISLSSLYRKLVA